MKNKTTDEMIEEMGYLLIRLREDPKLEFEPRVFKTKLKEIVQQAKAEGAREERERIVEQIKGIPLGERYEDYQNIVPEKSLELLVTDIISSLTKSK